MLVRDLVNAMESIAPSAYAEAWDRVGLQVGTPEHELGGPVVLTIDLTERVLAEAVGMGASAIVAYHPPIWQELGRLTDASAPERIIRGAIEAGMAIFTPHTALDAAEGGVTDWLCEGLSAPAGESKENEIAGDCRSLSPHVEHDADQAVKIVTFVPPKHADEVRGALATGGAGIVGAYRLCSFATPGAGTFLGGEGTNPAAGQSGRLERVDEVRLEMVCSKHALPIALKTLREFHPYEEPAFDVYELMGKPRRRIGAGRRLLLDRPATIGELCERFKAHLGRARVRYALPDERATYTTLGVVPGAGASMLGIAAADGCELFVTGEMKHHEIVEALHKGVGVLLAGHTNTERGYLPRLARRIKEALPALDARISEADTDILTIG